MPEDVVYRILLCLPVISLLRFKSVCKSWCSLIQSSNFIAQHLNYRSTFKENYNGNLIIFHFQRTADSLRFPHSVDVNLFTDEKLEESLNLDLPYYCDRRGKYVDHRGDDNGSIINLHMVASLDGIICLHHRESGEILLWNPAIKQLRLLPEGMLHPSRRRTQLHFGVRLGIGFDVKTNEYKVVRILLADLNSTCRVEVYNLSTDSWRIINTDLPCGYFFSDPKAPLKSGIYCWLVRISNPIQYYCDSILTFDFSNELFETIPLPDVCSIRYDVGSQLDIISEKIACICRKFSPVSSYTESCSFKINSTCHLDIWVLDEYGVKESWTKLYTIGPFSMFSPMRFLKNGELILLANDQGLFLCNPLTQEIKNVQVQGRPILSPWLHVASYKESLVSIEKWNGAANIEAFAGSHLSNTLP